MQLISPLTRPEQKILEPQISPHTATRQGETGASDGEHQTEKEETDEQQRSLSVVRVNAILGADQEQATRLIC